MKHGVNRKALRKVSIWLLVMTMLVTGFNGKFVYATQKSKEKVSKGKIQYVNIVNKNTIKLGWKKIAKTNKYQIQYSTNKNMKKSIIKTVKKRRSCKIYKLKNNKNYYFRIRGIKGKTKGKWSNIKKVTLNSDSIDAINLINSKYNLKLSLNAKVVNYKTCEEKYEFNGKSYKGCRIFAKIQLSETDFAKTDKLIQNSKNSSYSIYDAAVEEIDWWNLKKKNIIKSQDFFNTVKVFENKEDNQGIVIRGHMEVYVVKSVKQNYRLVYLCYEGG